jgi:hypothetical protein
MDVMYASGSLLLAAAAVAAVPTAWHLRRDEGPEVHLMGAILHRFELTLIKQLFKVLTGCRRAS